LKQLNQFERAAENGFDPCQAIVAANRAQCASCAMQRLLLQELG
jgi:hypothetical protein